MKSYTDLEQSKALSKILQLESADMFYALEGFIAVTSPYIKENLIPGDPTATPCWSLAALLGVLPNENMLVKTTDGEYYCLAKDIMTKHYNNPIDACVAIIEKLNELNLL